MNPDWCAIWQPLQLPYSAGTLIFFCLVSPSSPWCLHVPSPSSALTCTASSSLFLATTHPGFYAQAEPSSATTCISIAPPLLAYTTP
ncbi:hypothetical protein SORBI_3009G129650 [Sorghum bicolor]|uniref:Uncharacterized protein n=1 Tax=Sorghum bicolor TaxID=4558 RepID=A0A1B6P856_SORBI|nr:hypothetical protein SORBI_3009G129650 [Sorghum bicolor]